MDLADCLNITKSAKFTIFVYTKGHIEDSRGIEESPIEIFDIDRDEKGKFPFFEYSDCEVVEIIPHSTGVNIVVELPRCYERLE